MLRLLCLLLVLGVPFARAGDEPVGGVSGAKSIAVVSAIEPWVHGTSVGFFFGSGWLFTDPAFDINAIAVETLKESLNREVALHVGREVGIDPLFTDTPSNTLWEESTRAKLAELGAKWASDYILIIHGGEASNWISHSGQLRGIGFFRQGPKRQAFCVLLVSIFDCRAGNFLPAQAFIRGRELPDIEWPDNWLEFSSSDRKTMYECIGNVVKESLPQLLAKVSLATAESVEKTRPETNFFGRNKPSSFIPANDEFAIPEGETKEVIRAAVISAFKGRGWKVISPAPDRIIGTIIKGKNEAVETAVIGEHSVTLTPTRYELRPDGTRFSIEPHQRWHRNLKESIATALLEFRANSL